MLGLGAMELTIILAIAGLLFGARRLPEIGSGLGEGIRNFKGALAAESEAGSQEEKES